MDTAAELRRRFGGLGRAFWSLQVGLFLNRSGQFVQPLLTFWLTGVHQLSVSAAGAVVATYGLGSMCGTALGGVIADRHGRRITLLASSLGAAGALVALSRAPNVPAIVAGAFVLALTYDLHRPAIHAMVADLVAPADRVRAYSLTYVTINLGFAVAPALAGAIAGHGYRGVFLSAAVIQLGWALYVWRRVPESRPEPTSDEPTGSVRDVLRDRTYVAWLVAMAFAALVPHQGFVALSAWMKSEGFTPAEFGKVIGLNGVLIVVLQPWVAPWISRRDPIHMFIASCLLQGVGFSLHGLGLGLPGHAVAVTVWTLGEIASAPVTSAVVATLAPVELRARYQGLLGVSFSAASLLGPLVGGVVVDHFGGWLWVACLAVGVASAGWMFRLGPALRARMAA